MKEIIDWGVETLKAQGAPVNVEMLSSDSKIILFTSLSILLAHEGLTDNLSPDKKDWPPVLNCEDKNYLGMLKKAKLYAGICNFNSLVMDTIFQYLPSNRAVPLSNIQRIFRKYYKDWPNYSGSFYYPVKYFECQKLNESEARDAYIKYWDDEINMWDRTTYYGKQRWELVHYVHERLLKEITERISITDIGFMQNKPFSK